MTIKKVGIVSKPKKLEIGEIVPPLLEWLRQRGCTYGSGFYIAEPMRLDALAAYLKTMKLADARNVFAIRPQY